MFPVKKNKGTIAALALILIAGLGLYFAYLNKEVPANPLPATTSSSAAEQWQTFPLPTRSSTTKAGRTTTTKASTTTAPATNTTSNFVRTTTAAPTTTQKSNYPYNYPGIAPAVAATPKDPYMICVNRNYALPSGYTFTRAVCVDIYPEKIEMEKTAAAQYKLMYEAALKDGAEIIPHSGYRDTARQKNNFDNKIASYVSNGYSRAQAIQLAAKGINPPGCSEHEAGLAMDICVKGKWGVWDSFKDTKEYTWLMNHAQDYGFILRYAKEKEELTQVKYEPWHWRYVGVANAKAIKASGKCLEEYLGLA